MVAYSFKSAFWQPIQDRTKRQTIRNPRNRHAYPGERIQLYGKMRQPGCFKIIPDPVCVGVDMVEFDLRMFDRPPQLIVNGILIAGEAADAYAEGDGFKPILAIGAFEVMCRWWTLTHGRRVFHGIAIRWDDQP